MRKWWTRPRGHTPTANRRPRPVHPRREGFATQTRRCGPPPPTAIGSPPRPGHRSRMGGASLPAPADAPSSPLPQCPPGATSTPRLPLHFFGAKVDWPPAPAFCLRLPPRGQPIEDDRDEAQPPAAGRTLQRVDLEDAAEQHGPDEAPTRARPRDARRRPATTSAKAREPGTISDGPRALGASTPGCRSTL